MRLCLKAARKLRRFGIHIKQQITNLPTLVEIPGSVIAAMLDLAALLACAAGADRTLGSNSGSSVKRIRRFDSEIRNRRRHGKGAAGAAQTPGANQRICFLRNGFSFPARRGPQTVHHSVTTSPELRADNSYYDLLASEARLASCCASPKAMFRRNIGLRLGRQLTLVQRQRALISWTGTMFEYLMPLLVMRTYDETLLDQTYQAVLERQIEYGQERGVRGAFQSRPTTPATCSLNYQYAPFGVPGLGLKQGLVQDLVVAPYATMLAALIDAPAAMANLIRLQKEAPWQATDSMRRIDYTPERLPRIRKRDRAHLHGPPPGHESGGACRCAQRQRYEKRFHAGSAEYALPNCYCRNDPNRRACGAAARGGGLDRQCLANGRWCGESCLSEPPISRHHAPSYFPTATTT